MSRKIVVSVTAAQLRCLNAALALLEAEVETDDDQLHGVRLDLVERTRSAVHDALRREGIEP